MDQTPEPITIEEYLKMYEKGIDDFSKHFEVICDDKAINFIVQQFCRTQKDFAGVMLQSIDAVKKESDTQ